MLMWVKVTALSFVWDPDSGFSDLIVFNQHWFLSWWTEQQEVKKFQALQSYDVGWAEDEFGEKSQNLFCETENIES